MILEILRRLFQPHGKAQEVRCVTIRGGMDRSDVRSDPTRQKGTQTLVDRSVLDAIETWRPPKGSTVQLVVCVNLETRVLFHAVKPSETPTEVVNQLDRIAHCLICTEEPDLPDEWINELDVTWNLFEEAIENV